MRNRKIIGLICFFILIFVVITSVFSEVFSEKIIGEEILIDMFEKSKANILETNVYTSLYLNDEYFELEEMENILNDLTEHLGMKDKIQEVVSQEYSEADLYEELLDYKQDTLYVTTLSEIGINKIYATYLDHNLNLSTFIIHSMEYEGESESYIIIDILQNKSYKEVVSLLNKSKDVLINYGDQINTTISLVGTYVGKITSDEGNNIITKILRSIDGETVERVEDDFYTSITAYTPYLHEAIQYFDKTVNLNLAIRYNAYEDSTYLWIATPLITTTY